MRSNLQLVERLQVLESLVGYLASREGNLRRVRQRLMCLNLGAVIAVELKSRFWSRVRPFEAPVTGIVIPV